MNNAHLQELARLGVATVYEAAGRTGLIDIPLHQIIPNSRIAGPVRTVLCAPNDNLMVHAVLATAQPGEILAITMPEPAPVALIGELLATQARMRNVAGILLDAAVRDVEELRALGLPIWARYIRVRGAQRATPGQINVPITIGTALIMPGDTLLLDSDGAVVIAAARTGEVLEAAQQREVRESLLRARFLAGELSIDIYKLRATVQDALEEKRKDV
jgi:4-hydroxy-4-methyl-2-oxoglutarate aldolase